MTYSATANATTKRSCDGVAPSGSGLAQGDCAWDAATSSTGAEGCTATPKKACGSAAEATANATTKRSCNGVAPAPKK